jgi:hypothetical protein
MDSNEAVAKNQKLVDALREGFTPIADRLTPEIEPATVYLLSLSFSESDADRPQDK